MTKLLDGRIALVTGGSRGIGRGISIALARAGAHVVVNYASRSDAADETVRLCQSAGGSAEAIGFDVQHSESVNVAVDGLVATHGRIDILVNNAGITSDGLFVRLKDEDWRRTLAINLDGAFFCSRAVTKSMMKARFGRIINISSVVGEMGNAGQAAYVASKAGLIGLTKAVARELASRNITVNAVTPGFIETEMTESLPEKAREDYLKSIPLGKFGSSEDIAEAVVFFAGPMSSYITGQVLGINGGMYM